MTFWRRSLTFRLVSLFVLVTTCLLVGLGAITLIATDQHFRDLDETYLRDKSVLVQEIARQACCAQDLTENLRRALQTQTGLGLELRENGQAIYRSPGFETPAGTSGELLHTPSGSIVQWDGGNRQLRALLVALPIAADASVGRYEALLVLDTEHHDHFMATFRSLMGIYVVLAIALGAILGWWATRRGLTPLRPIIAKARHITASHLDDRIPIQNVPTELEPLTHTLNQMLERLEIDFKRLSDFSADLAHELRTPISNMLVQAQVTLGKRREPEEYQEILLSTVEELERLSHMVTDMLYLAQTENHLQAPNLCEIALETQTSELFEFYGLMAEDKQVTLELRGQGTVAGDRIMIRRAISNLLSNAIRHARNQTTVTVSIETHPLRTTLSVSNEGDVIPQDIAPRLFDRFYRADDSRSHPGAEGAGVGAGAGARAGLGLAITKAVMLAHGGSISVKSDTAQTVFSLVFPDDKNHSVP